MMTLLFMKFSDISSSFRCPKKKAGMISTAQKKTVGAFSVCPRLIYGYQVMSAAGRPPQKSRKS
jgi:hypothetical protein